MGRQLMGFREYAEHRRTKGLVGTTLRAVQKAVESGRISTIPGDKGRAKIDPAVADIQWARNTDVDQSARANAGRLGGTDMPGLGPSAKQVPSTDAGSAGAGGESGGTSPYWLAKTRREQAEASKAELQLAELSGDLVRKADTRRAAFEAGRMLRDLILAVPTKLAAELASVSDPIVIERRIREELRRPLEQVSNLELDH